MSKLILCLLLLLNVCICEDAKQVRTFEESDGQSGINVRLGEEFALKMKSNPSTGYSWKFLNQEETKDSVEFLRQRFENPSAVLGRPPLIGAGGYTYYHFKAVGVTNEPVSLKFSYARHFSNLLKSPVTSVYKINVN